MYNVLIAEDSKPILRNIRGLIEASGLPVRVVATAANGEEALRAFEREPIDILLTDIRMPKMDGLTLIEQAKRLRPKLKAVLISGYSDFEYARKAINLQVSDYLMKPVGKEQLLEVMGNVLAQLRDAEADELAAFRSIVPSDCWEEWRRSVQWDQHPKIFLIIHKQPFSGSSGQRAIGEAYAAACPIVPVPSWAVPTVADEQLLLVADASWADRFAGGARLLEDFRSHLEAGGLTCSVLGWLAPTEWRRIPDQFREASRLLEDRLLALKPFALDFEQLKSQPEPGFEDVDRIAGPFTALIEQLSKERFALLLADQLEKWRRGHVRAAELKRFVAQLAGAFAALLEEDPADAGWLFEQRDRLLALPDYDRFGAELLAWAEQCFQQAKTLNRKSGDELFGQMVAYLNANVYSNVSIQQLAHHFHISPSYVSRIMKRFSGQTFVTYYTELRIKEACRLMDTRPEMKVKDISDALGFGDPHYFSKVFKERVGASPMEYRLREREAEGD